MQEPVLFVGTIFENVAHGLAGTPLANVSDAEKQTLIEDACKAAFAHDFIMDLPEVRLSLSRPNLGDPL